jgi:sugar (pentulose or hexulose) kinase
MAAYASAITDESAVVDSIGTAEYVMVTSGAFDVDERLYALCADVEHSWGPDQYVLGWGLPTGKVLQLLAERFCGGDFEKLLAAIDPAAQEAVRATSESTGAGASAEGLVFTVNDLRDLGEELLSIEGIPPDATAADIVRACVTQLSERIRDTVHVMAGIGGAPVDVVALTGSLFQRPEMVRHRQNVWKLPLRVSGLSEAVATGAAELAGDSYRQHVGSARSPEVSVR